MAGRAERNRSERPQTVDSYAAYAQGNIHFTDQFYATLGGRYTKDKKDGTYEQTVTNPFIGAGIFRAPEALTFPGVNDSRFTYRLGLNYEPTEDHLIFASYSTGYKSGGYNSGGGSASLSRFDAQGNLIPTRRIFDRETVQDWELGAKTSWLDRKLTANLTFYRMDISGYQDRAFDGVSFTVLNAGKLRQQGFEFDGVAKPIRGLSLFAKRGLPGFQLPQLSERARPAGMCAECRRRSSRRLYGRRTWRNPGPRGQAGCELAEVERPARVRLGRRCRHGRPDVQSDVEPVVLLEAV